MKKLLFGLMIAAVSFAVASVPTVSASAQSTKTYSKTLTAAADTITFTNVPSNIVAFQYTFDETSGTSSGDATLYGTINGEWVQIDSLAIADQAAAQTKVFLITTTSYLSYRIITTTNTGTVKASYLRRQDEN